MADYKRYMVQTKRNLTSPAVSIIVPVFKAEQYLDRCVDSIIAQTFDNWELLLIDDGSPDKCPEICDRYSDSDHRIKVFHKKNGGVASARELGVQNARGIYSIHVDPDDWIDSDTLKSLYERAIENDTDIVICDFLYEYSASYKVVSSQKINSSYSLLRQLLCHNLHGSLCNKLIRTDLYRKFNLHFPPEMVCWEDLYICCNLALHNCTVDYIPKAFYHYDLYSNGGSMTRMATMRTLEGMRLFCNYFNDKLGKDNMKWLNETKGAVLETAYRCDLMSAKELRDLYPEINDWFISKYMNDYSKVIHNALARVLNGSSLSSARKFQKVNSIVQRINIKLRKLL